LKHYQDVAHLAASTQKNKVEKSGMFLVSEKWSLIHHVLPATHHKIHHDLPSKNTIKMQNHLQKPHSTTQDSFNVQIP
jgi:hypothetical protein